MLKTDWRIEAIDELKKYPLRKQAIINIPQRIKALEDTMHSINGATTSPVPLYGGTSKHEDRLINCVTEIERLKHTYMAAKRFVRIMDNTLAGMKDKEKRLLELLYIKQDKGAMAMLMDEFGYNIEQLNHLRDEALYNLTIRMFGLVVS